MKLRYLWISISLAMVFGIKPLPAADSPGNSGLITLPEIEVLDADMHEYRIGERFILNVKKSDLSRAGGVKNLRFRVFRGTVEQLSKGGFKSEDNCDYFRSRSFSAETYNGGLEFLTDFNITWLLMTGNMEFKSQVFVLVIEETNNTGDLLKLHPDQVRDYFSKGYQFVVTAPRKATSKMISEFIEYEQESYRSTEKIHKAALVPSPTEAECRSFTNVLVKSKSKHEMLAYLCEEEAASEKS